MEEGGGRLRSGGGRWIQVGEGGCQSEKERGGVRLRFNVLKYTMFS